MNGIADKGDLVTRRVVHRLCGALLVAAVVFANGCAVPPSKKHLLKERLIAKFRAARLPYNDIHVFRDKNTPTNSNVFLVSLDCSGQRGILNISALKGEPVRICRLSETHVDDLQALSGSPVHILTIDNSWVSDLTPLRGTQLKFLSMRHTKVTDLTPLLDLPLEDLIFSPEQITAGLQDIRNKRGLKRINQVPAEHFWYKYDRGIWR